MICILNRAPLLYRAAFCKSINFGRMTKLILTRNCKHQTNKTPVRMQERFRLKDGVSHDYKLIYRDQKEVLTILSTTYHFAWISLLTTFGTMAYLLYDVFILQTPEDLTALNFFGSKIPRLRNVHKFDLVCVCALIASLLLMYARGIPIRIYHNPKQKLYKAVFVKIIFSKGQAVTFAEGSAVPVHKRGPFKDTLFYVNNNRMILLDEESFPVPAQREKMISRPA